MSFVLLVIATMAILTAFRLRALLDAERGRANQAERLAVSRGRSLSLASQELRGIATAMTSWRRFVPAASEGARGFGASHADRLVEGPARQVLRLADDLAEVANGPVTRSIHEAPARLGPIVDGAITAVGTQIQPGQRHWQVDPALRALTVRADRRALERALAALLRRSASHSRDGDVIALRWVTASETVAIVVEDEGDGLAVADPATDSAAAQGSARGLDLGLSMARSLAAAHGGDIRLESAPGIGARAWLTLPRARVLEAA